MKKELAIIISKLKPIEKPKYWLEQYTIPSELAAEILNLAYLNNHIKDKFVCDFGCGSGRLAIGAAIMGAKKVYGIDIDKYLKNIFKENLKIAEDLIGRKLKVKFVCKDIFDFKERCDTVIQNPPFGFKGERKDIDFLEKATSLASFIYSIHHHSIKNRKFIKDFLEKRGFKIIYLKKQRFIIPYLFKFHRKYKYSYYVDLYAIQKI